MMFLTSLIQQINNHKISMNSSVINSEEYHKLFEEYILAKNEKEKEEKLNELQLLKVYKGEFMNIYMAQLNIILNDVNENFTARFRKNKFKSEDDKCIFEDYIQFLSSCKFDSKSLCLSDIINFWKETFIQMKNEEKIQLVEYYNNLEKESKKNFKLENDNNTLIVKYYEKKNRIDNINNYCFSCLIADLYNNSIYKLDYYLNKNLKPNFYKDNLFIMQKKDIWKQLITNILRSKAVKEAIDTLFECSYINILDDPSFLSQTLDNVKFFIYKTSSYASTNENSLRVYEYGLFNFEEKISESLLSFYSFNIVSNLHEICGHFNIRVQNFNSLNNSFDSPTIEDNSNLYSDYAKLRKKESGETLEIKLFGRKIDSLTIKEALFILEPINYLNSLEDFTEKFKKCNYFKFEDIITKGTINSYLLYLGINYNELPKEFNKVYNGMVPRTNEITSYEYIRGNHAPEFYIEIDRKFIEYVASHYNDKILK